VQQGLEEMLRLAFGFALLGANLSSVQACFMQAAEQGGSPAILLVDVIQSLPKGLLLPLIPCQLAQLEQESNCFIICLGLGLLDQRIYFFPRLGFALGQRFQFLHAPGLGLLGLSSPLSLASLFGFPQKLPHCALRSQLHLWHGRNLAQSPIQLDRKVRFSLSQA